MWPTTELTQTPLNTDELVSMLTSADTTTTLAISMMCLASKLKPTTTFQDGFVLVLKLPNIAVHLPFYVHAG